jgi:hypothetical protein
VEIETILTVSQEDLSLSLRRFRVRTRLRLAQLEVGLNVYMGALCQTP